MFRHALSIVLLLAAALPAAAYRHDPLNNEEIDQLREAAQDPDTRLKLMVKFLRARMVALEQMRSDPRLAQNRGEQVHDLLEDMLDMMDQLDDYIDDYTNHKQDMRKGLKDVIEGDTEFQLKLRAVKETTASEAESRDYSFILHNLIEAVNSSLDDARQLLPEQEAMAKRKELRKPD